MADLSELDRSGSVKIAGGNPTTGLEDNFMEVDANGNAKVSATSAGPVTPGTAALFSDLIGGQFNTVLPTLTNTQQAALQLDSSGRLIIRPLTSTDVVSAAQSGIWNIGTLTSITNPVAVTGTFWQATQPISAASLPLPTGAATETTIAKLPLAQASATSGQSGILAQGAVTTAAPTYVTGQTDPLSLNTSGGLRVDGSGVIQPISAASLPLPTGAATSSLQTTGNTSLSSIDTKTPALGQALAAASVPVVLTAAQITTLTPLATIAVTQSTSPWVVSGTVTATNPSVGTVAATPPTSATYIGGSVTTAAPTYTTGQMDPLSLNTSGGLRVDGSGVTQPISASSLPLPTGASTSANQTTLGSQTTKINDGTNTAAIKAASTAPIATDPALVVTMSPNAGMATAALQSTANATLAAIDAGIPTALGQTTMAASMPVTIASNQSAIPVTVTFPYDENYGTVGATTLRVASQIGNATGAANFGAGTTGAQTLRVAANTYDGIGNAITSASNGGAGNQLLHVQTPNTTTTAVALGALNATVSIAMAGLTSCGFQIAAGTLIGTITPQCSVDGGTTWTNVSFLQPSTNVVFTSYSFSSANPTTLLTVLPIGGSTNIRVIVSAYTSGTANAILTASEISVNTGSASSAPADLFGSGTITALNGNVTAALHGCSVIVFNITGTWVASLTVEASVDGGVNWFPVYAFFQTYDLFSNNLSANQSFSVQCGGYQQIRIRAASFTSGTVNIAWDASVGTNVSSTYCFNPTPGNFQNVPNAYQTATFSPDPHNVTTFNLNALNQDSGGNLQIRGPILTDEGSLRDDFSGAALTTALTGTLNFTNGSTVVTGNGTLFTTQVGIGQYIKRTSDSETAYAQVTSVNSDVSLNIIPYTGTTGAGVAGVVSNWATSTGAGASITVGSSLVNIISGTTSGSSVYITNDIDYLPISMNSNVSISQRIANQIGMLGFVDSANNNAAVVQFSGTVNTTVSFITAFSSAASDIQTTAVTLPNGGNTSTAHTYTVDLGTDQATLSIDGVVVAINKLHLPGPYVHLSVQCGWLNSAAVTSSTMAIDAILYQNLDRIEIKQDYSGEPIAITGSTYSGQPDNNAPVKVGGVYNSVAPTFVSGNRTDLQTDVNGNVKTVLSAALPTGANTIGAISNTSFIATQATPANLQVTATPIAITKGTQGATGFTVQDLKDAGRNQSNLFMVNQLVTTATDTLLSLTGYKSGAAVGATTTPAVVTAGKTYRITSITMTYIAITTAGTAHFTLRANTSGVVAITSPIVNEWTIGGPSATAGVSQTVSIPIPDGMEFAAGTGIGVSMQGFGATGTAVGVGYGQIAIYGYEY